MSIFLVILAICQNAFAWTSVNKGEPTVLSALHRVQRLATRRKFLRNNLVLREETIFILEKELHLKARLPFGATFLVDGFQPCDNGSAG